MKRREFVTNAGVVIVLVPAARLLSSCGDDDDEAPPQIPGEPPPPPPPPSADVLTFTSSVVAGHSHSVTIEVALIADPPAGGLQETTSVDAGHSHVVVLTVDDLDRIDAGETVMKETSTEDQHLHTFEFRKAAAG